jgi:hypothetical protein
VCEKTSTKASGKATIARVFAKGGLAMKLSVTHLGLLLLTTGMLGCPQAKDPAAAEAEWERKLDARQILPLKPNGSIAIKRDVHSIDVGAEALAFGDAFARTMADSSKHFGLIRVLRKRANASQPFTVHERFQGRYGVDQALHLTGPFWEPILVHIEDQFASDYGIIQELNMRPKEGEDARLVYEYLDGSPIAGSSTFTIHALDKDKCRLTQVFQYQEQQESFIQFFANDGLKLHDQVVYSQAKQSADALQAKILGTDLPEPYQQP